MRSQWVQLQRFASLGVLGLVSLCASGCLVQGSAENSSSASQSSSPNLSSLQFCTQASAWTPSVTGIGAANHNATVSVTEASFSGSQVLTGLDQAYDGNRLVNIDFTVPDVGTGGSVTLTANVTSFPSSLVGWGYPVLVEFGPLSAGAITADHVKLNSACGSNGVYTCSGGSCGADSSNPCGPTSTAQQSAFVNRTHWEQHQIPAFGYVTTNTFPTCNWGVNCAYTAGANFFGGTGKLPAGSYRARYLLMASNYASLSGYSGSLSVKVTTKNAASQVGAAAALNLNVILVGQDNVLASRSAKGQENLDALFTHVMSHYNQSNLGVKLGSITAYEAGCAGDVYGEAWANTDIDQLNELFSKGSAQMPAGAEGKSLNIFITSTIPYTGSGTPLTVLGVAGAIRGPMTNGSGSSGLAFSSFNKLDDYNPQCNSPTLADGLPCPLANQEYDFIDMGATISHEMGHYLGLNHPSESDGTSHDPIPDTPRCQRTGSYVTWNSCLAINPPVEPGQAAMNCGTSCPGYNGTSQFCASSNCQFNHVMWYTAKSFNTATDQGDLNLFSPQSSSVLRYSPYIY